jgi:hypothetical protein
MGLIILGGIGFLVMKELLDCATEFKNAADSLRGWAPVRILIAGGASHGLLEASVPRRTESARIDGAL